MGLGCEASAPPRRPTNLPVVAVGVFNSPPEISRVGTHLFAIEREGRFEGLGCWEAQLNSFLSSRGP